MRVAKWGNSLAIRLPRSVVEALGLEEGDSVEVNVLGSRSLEIGRPVRARELIARLRKYRGRLPAGLSSTGSRRMSAAEAFFDTSVLLYLLSVYHGKADRAEALLAGGGVVSVQVLNEFASVALRKLVLALPEVREVLSAIRAACSVRPIDIETHELGLDILERFRVSLYDSLIIAAAVRAGCTTLYAEDLQHAQSIDWLTIRNPFLAE